MWWVRDSANSPQSNPYLLLIIDHQTSMRMFFLSLQQEYPKCVISISNFPIQQRRTSSSHSNSYCHHQIHLNLKLYSQKLLLTKDDFLMWLRRKRYSTRGRLLVFKMSSFLKVIKLYIQENTSQPSTTHSHFYVVAIKNDSIRILSAAKIGCLDAQHRKITIFTDRSPFLVRFLLINKSQKILKRPTFVKEIKQKLQSFL